MKSRIVELFGDDYSQPFQNDVPGWTDWEGAEIDVFSAWGWNNLIDRRMHLLGP